MNQEIENQSQANINMNDKIQKILSLREITSLKKRKNLNILAPNYNSKLHNQRKDLEDSRKSFDNFINIIPQKELKRFNTQKDINRIIKNHRIIKNIPNTHNDFILAKKNNLYGNNLNNNDQRNFTTNNVLKLNNDVFAKKIKSRFNRTSEKAQNYIIINNQTNNYNSFVNNIKENNNNSSNNINNNISKYDKKFFNFNKKLSNDLIYKSELNSTMTHPYDRKNEFNKDNIINISNRKNINENQKEINKIKSIKDKFLTNSKLTNKKIIKSKINMYFIQRQHSEIKPKIRKKVKNNKNDLSWDFGNYADNINLQNMNFYRKSKSGIIPKNFNSEKKTRRQNKIKKENKNDNDSTDKEINEIVDNLGLSFENDNENKLNKTMITKPNTYLNDSINLSDLADDLINLQPEQESKQETIPSTSNLDTDGFLENSNSNNINMNNINLNIPFNTNKISNTKPTIVNNFFISSPETKNKSNNYSNDFKYNLFVVNEYNNTNNNFNNNINNDFKNDSNINYKANINIPTLVTRTYKSPFLFGNNQDKINTKDINEIDENELNLEFNQIKNISNENNNYQNDLDNLNYSKSINDEQMLKTNSFQNEKNEKFSFLNNQINYPNQNNNLKEKSKYNKKEIKFRESILRDLLSSHKNTPSNNNVQISDKKILDSDDKLYKNNDIIYNNQNDNNNYFNDEFMNNSNNLESAKINDINNYNQNSEEGNNIINYSNQKKPYKKLKGHISFNLDNNIYIKFKADDLINNSLVTDRNGQIYQHNEKNMLIYQEELKLANPKSILKSFYKNEIGINHEYVYVENLQERQILPDLYDDFEEEDLKSLEKCLEKSVDKIQHF